jgi:hypothetical protein
MSHDYLKKEPSKTEKMLYELAMNQNQMQKGLWSTSTVVMAAAMAAKIKPEELAALIVEDGKIKEYSEKVNEIIKQLEEEKHKGHEHTQKEKEQPAA